MFHLIKHGLFLHLIQREEHDHRGIDDKMKGRRVGEILRETVEHPRKTAGSRIGNLHEQRRRDLDERLREDDGHNAGVVHPERHESLLHAVGVAAADTAARGVDGDLAHALSEHDRPHDDEQEEDDENRQFRDRSGRLHARETEITLPRADDRLGQTRSDVDHDDERSAVAHSEGGDLIGDPHDEKRGGGHADDCHELEADPGIGDDFNAGEGLAESAGVAEHRSDAPRLHHAKHDRQIAGDLRELLATAFTFLLEFFKRRNDRTQELNHDRCRNVRPDREKADAALLKRAARKDVEPVQEPAAGRALPRSLDDALKRAPIDSRGRDLRNKTAHEHEAERDQYFLAQFRNAECVGKTLHHCHI